MYRVSMFEFLTVDLEQKPGSEDWRILEKVFAARANVRSLKNQGKSAGNAANAQVNFPLYKKNSTTEKTIANSSHLKTFNNILVSVDTYHRPAKIRPAINAVLKMNSDNTH